MKTPYIKKISNNQFRIISEQGMSIGTCETLKEAMTKVRRIEFVKMHKRIRKIAAPKIDLRDIDSFSYSGILRELRQSTSSKIIKDFIEIYHDFFEKLVIKRDQNLTDRALAMTVKFLDKKYGVDLSSNQKRPSAGLIEAPRFAQVCDGVYRGGAPTIGDVKRLRENFGIRRIISFDEQSGLEINTACRDMKIQHIVVPVQASNFKQVENLANLDWPSLLLDGGPAYIHCLHGKDRTGLVVALFRVQEGMSCSEAIKEADKFDFCNGLKPSVRKFYIHLLNQICESDDHNSDQNKVWELPTPDYMADYKFNQEYLPNQDTFAIELGDNEGPLGYKIRDDVDNSENQDIPKYTVKDIPMVGINDNVSNVTIPGPASIGTGYIATI